MTALELDLSSTIFLTVPQILTTLERSVYLDCSSVRILSGNILLVIIS